MARRVRMRWLKAPSLRGDDQDFLTIVAMIQQAWQMTDEQAQQFLANCEA